MLIELRIKNFAVMDDVSLDLRGGLNVLSGETGAGKSIVVGALGLLLGERASSDVVRQGARRAVVEGVFDVSHAPPVLALLDELGIEPEDGLLILRREVAAEGRNRAWINGSPASARAVGALGSALVDIHGQHEHQTLLRPPAQRRILDDFAGAAALTAAVRERHAEARRLQADMETRRARARELESQADFLRFQLDEIGGADLEAGEDERLEAEARRLEHSRELMESAEEIHQALYGADVAISDQLARLRHLLAEIVRLDPSLEATAASLEEAYHALVDVGRTLGDYAGQVEHDPHRLDEVRRRLDLLFRLKRKYGPELDDVIATRERLRGELDELEGTAFEVGALEDRLGRIRAGLSAEAAELTRMRSGAAERLATEVQAILPHLGMAGARVSVVLTPLPEPGPDGAESVEFRASLNVGFDPQPLARIASGGELSRVMLALKTVLAEVDHVPVLVFDEIDAGIGGVVASRVAERLRDVAARHQVLVVTHLPQLASRAHAHFLVRKDAEAERVATEIAVLDGEARVTEIARMLGGDPESAASLEHAREMLAAG